jgi:hypothetical protein
VLAVVGSLLPLFEQVLTFSTENESYSLTLWGVESSFDFPAADQPLFGVPVVVAAALLTVSAVLVSAAPRLPAWSAGPTRLGALASAALLTGSVWTVGQLVLAVTTDGDAGGVRTTVGAGTGALVLACVVALAGGLLVQTWSEGAAAVPAPEPEGAVVYRLPDDDDVDADPPPLVFPAPEDSGDGGA